MNYVPLADAWFAKRERRPNTAARQRRILDIFLKLSPTPDNHVFITFAKWLATCERDDGRIGYADSTRRLMLDVVRAWFRWLYNNDMLPDTFDFEKANYNYREGRGSLLRRKQTEAPEPPEGIEDILSYYGSPQYAAWVQAKADERKTGIDDYKARLALDGFRNLALVHCLAESAGRVSEVLQLSIEDFPPAAYSGDVWRVKVTAKGGNPHHLRLLSALPHVRRYVQMRDVQKGPLFVYHSKRYEGGVVSARIAWQVVNDAAKALGIEHIHPHDFRHWCATKLLNDGVPIDVVQQYLGHRRIETTRVYYAHTNEARVDDAARRVLKGDSNDDR